MLLAAALAQADVPLPPPPPGTSLRQPVADAPLPPPPPPEEPLAAPTAARPGASELPRFGLSLEGGVPEGGALGVMYRPLPYLRLWAGPAWNYASFGVQGGVAYQPFRLVVSPVVSLEAGDYFSADVSFLATGSSGVPEEIEPLMKDVRYRYGAAHLGLEVGSPRGFAFSLRLGLAWVSVQAKGTARATADAGSGAGSGTATVEFDDPRVRGTVPSLKLGLQYWF
jgi:hypothetical protein